MKRTSYQPRIRAVIWQNQREGTVLGFNDPSTNQPEMKRDPADIEKFSRTSRSDLVLIGLALLFSVLAILWISSSNPVGLPTAKSVDIYLADSLIKTADFVEDKVISLLGVGMEIVVRDGEARVLKSDCPRQICVNMGWIRHPGDTIVCAPNRVLIEIKSTGNVVDAAVS